MNADNALSEQEKALGDRLPGSGQFFEIRNSEYQFVMDRAQMGNSWLAPRWIPLGLLTES